VPQLIQHLRGDFMVLPNDSFGKHLISKTEYEPWFYNVIKNVLTPGNNCIDCGANLGYHTVTMAKLIESSGSVLSIEPQRIIFQQMTGNVFLNNLRNVNTINAALGDQEGVAYMDPIDYNNEDINIGATSVGSSGEEVKLTTLDSLVNDKINIHFIKIDVQGSEVKLLNGAKNLINRCKPIMFIEIEEPWLSKAGTSSEELRNKLIGMGYILIHITNGSSDYLAIPIEKESLIKEYIKDLNCPIETFR